MKVLAELVRQIILRRMDAGMLVDGGRAPAGIDWEETGALRASLKPTRVTVNGFTVSATEWYAPFVDKRYGFMGLTDSEQVELYAEVERLIQANINRWEEGQGIDGLA